MPDPEDPVIDINPEIWNYISQDRKPVVEALISILKYSYGTDAASFLVVVIGICAGAIWLLRKTGRKRRLASNAGEAIQALIYKPYIQVVRVETNNPAPVKIYC